MNPLREKQYKLLKELNCEDLARKVNEITRVLSEEEIDIETPYKSELLQIAHIKQQAKEEMLKTKIAEALSQRDKEIVEWAENYVKERIKGVEESPVVELISVIPLRILINYLNK